MTNKPFHFKQFKIDQDRCAMKVGTDGVLLGAWATIENNPFSILDIGAGTGIITLMLAQRSHAEIIDAIEIDDDAYEQCVNNFEQSPWGDRLFCYHAALEEFTEELLEEGLENDDKYDLIVSNPPFYSEDYKTDNIARDLARFQEALPFKHLLENTSKLLSENGCFCVIIPFNEEARFIELGKQHNLFTNKILHVKGNETSEIKRSLIQLSFRKSEIHIEKLTIETARHQYTQDYINLTKDFYLKMK
ncbi:tRNA1(Val) (adenine(37)-N6)-methyltransferase [Seonamhaeicola aphaedonensis]|uniref:tRNA1(Val) (adenine(37)-N6)-methyltransferase n=1 Tax=Seonamhaeicola aphaedonensis TaxID=1461338 RepID=A0A3D9H5D9_9FLAO|nr:methyltransferase [Seonamhaeicola aphaedonensis]RED44735.1 tRNA1Val (adenine37-N6)-methyltransferase [Seonamhaeicola aphaedonensis]